MGLATMGQHMTPRSFFFQLLALCVFGTTLQAGEFDRIRDQMKAVYTTVNADGTIRVAKQFNRWEYFWERRLLPNGDFPTSAQYMSEALGVERRNSRLSEDLQAIPTWKEIGPEAPATIDQSQWNGIGRVNCMAFSYQNDNLLWLGSAAGGLWKSTNNGGLWKYVAVPGFPMFGVSDIQLAKSDDKIIFVATGDAETALPGSLSGYPVFSYGVIKSTDGGLTWTPTGLSYTPESNNVVCKLWVNPTDPMWLLRQLPVVCNALPMEERRSRVQPMASSRMLWDIHQIRTSCIAQRFLSRVVRVSTSRQTWGKRG